ncbi:MAG: hypothetical protein KBC53_04050 [Nitrosomonas sp.]|nr:hypothetical protein [Nitrosomonas sp.]
MKRIIYKPLDEEIKPASAVDYYLPVSGYVFDVLVDDDYTPEGRTVLYDSLAGIMLSEPFVHHFAGWEV